MRVGGRIKHADVPFCVKHPVILPKESPVTINLVRYYHEKIYHQGRGITSNELRQNGYWILGGSRYIASIIFKCVVCRKLRGKPSTQKMSDLPEDRLAECPCFTYSGCDFFGPFVVKDRRSEVKVYGCLFTCLVSRAVHIEVAPSLSTDAFINCLRRFQSRRGSIRQLRCDRGSNFVGACNELKAALAEMDHTKIKEELLKNGCDWIFFKFNSPCSSHMAGVWERLIRTVRSILSGILCKNGKMLNNDDLRTYMCEVESIINSRPLAPIDNTSILEPLTPNHLLTLKSKVIIPPPGSFSSTDLYSRKRWRRIQHLVDQFWTRFREEYLHLLQSRQKWHKNHRNYIIGDIVLLKDENLLRGEWRLARVSQIFKGDDDRVRRVKIVCGDKNIDSLGKRTSNLVEYERPIHKLVLLLEATT